ncbi:MAG: Cas10/Cmr2 second palm domain-containing protein [Promethearchaeota archaeon]
MKNINAILIDIVSIQEYIFASNRLKHNVGASYIISRIYNNELKEALDKTFGISFDMNCWKENPSQILIENNKIPCEIGYIGGGNALILIKEKLKIKDFIMNFTRIILERYPGLRTAYGIIDDFDISNFKKSMEKIHNKLRENKNNFNPLVILTKYGVTANCPESGESAEIFKNEDNQFISAIVQAKILAESEALEKINKEFEKELKNKYIFTNSIDDLGQIKGKNYVGIIHIDGNKMGERIKSCKTLEEIRILSESIIKATSNAFKEMVNECIRNIENGKISNDIGIYLKTRKKDKKIILPFRPIIMSGDDITFICNGTLTFFLIEILIKRLITQSISDNKPISVCAGICIVKSKYPFYRAYYLAENLLKNAKMTSRKEENSSYIDFFISSGGFSGDFEDILKNYFNAKEGIAHFGPYRIDQDNSEKSYAELKKIIKEFHNWPKNKLLEFRELLFGSREIVKKFYQKLKIKDLKLHELIGKNYHIDIWENGNTPYFDAIEILEFYPKRFLEE